MKKLFNMLSGNSPETEVPEGTPSLQLNSVKFITTEQWSGRSSVIEKSNGEIVLFFITGNEHPDNTDQYINIKFSGDYGGTWSDTNKYLDGSGVSGMPMRAPDANLDRGPVMGYGMKLPNSDRLYCAMWSIDTGLSNGNNGSWMSHSDDGGKSWSTPVKLTYSGWSGVEDSTLIGEDYTVIGNEFYSGFREVDPLYPRSWQTNHVFKSTDGYHWTFVGDVSSNTDPVDGTKEIGIERVGSSKLTTLLRNFDNSKVYQGISTNLGITWPSPVDITTSQFGGAAIMRTVINTRSHLKLKNNWWLDPVQIAVGYESTTPGSSQPRRNMVAVSKDFGDTWYGPFYLDTVTRPDGGYGDCFYNRITGEYVAVIYRGVNDLTDGRIEQYNFKINWAA